MRRTKYYKTIFLIISLLLTGLLITGCGNKEQKVTTENIITVKTAKVKKEAISIPVHTSGRLESNSEIKLSFKTGGIIARMNAAEGEGVKKGEVLAELNLSEINSQVKQAEEAVKKAERDLSRIENLYKDSVATLEQFQNMTTAMSVAKSNLEIARFNQKHSTIKAPSDGIILKRFNEEGEITSPGMPVFLFGSSESGWIIKVGIIDKDLVKLSIGDTASVYLDAFPGSVFDASVTELGGAANPYTGTFEIELTLSETVKKLSSGFIAKADIYPSQTENVFIIPIEALYESDGNKGTVFTFNKNTGLAESLNITIKRILQNSLAVSKGLENTETVITDGVEYLSAGSKVNVK